MSSVAASLWKGDATHQGISGFLGAKNTVGTVLFGAIAGGAGADFTGGNFWQGAVTGGIVAYFNHSLHDGGDGTDPPKKGKTSDGKYYGGDGSGDLLDYFHRFVYETDQWNPIALAWDGIKGSLTETDRYGNTLSPTESNIKIASVIPIGKVTKLYTPTKSLFGHIFRNATGHVNPQTFQSQLRYMNLFEKVASNPNNLIKTASQTARAAGVLTYKQTFRNGNTVWVQTYNGKISNAGVNLP